MNRDIERWINSLTPDQMGMLISRLLIFYAWGMPARGIRAYIKKMRVEGVTRDYPG